MQFHLICQGEMYIHSMQLSPHLCKFLPLFCQLFCHIWEGRQLGVHPTPYSPHTILCLLLYFPLAAASTLSGSQKLATKKQMIGLGGQLSPGISVQCAHCSLPCSDLKPNISVNIFHIFCYFSVLQLFFQSNQPQFTVPLPVSRIWNCYIEVLTYSGVLISNSAKIDALVLELWGPNFSFIFLLNNAI